MTWEWEQRPYNFGCLPALPEGYEVVQLEDEGHFVARGPDDWESGIHWSPHACRQWCFLEAAA